MTTQREAFATYLNKFKHITGGLQVYSELNEHEKSIARDAFESAWQAALSQPNEPVAWRVVPRYEDAEGYCDYTESVEAVKKLMARGWKCVPLFTSPPNTSELEQANKVLEAKCKELEDILEAVRRHRKTYEVIIGEHEIKIADLTAKVEKMRDALVFYSIRINGDIASKALEECK